MEEITKAEEEFQGFNPVFIMGVLAMGIKVKKIIKAHASENVIENRDNILINKQTLISTITTEYDTQYANYPLSNLLDCIERQPTAYNVEKVVRQLKECRDIMLTPINRDCFGEECKYNDCSVCVFEKAIEIVRNGGE